MSERSPAASGTGPARDQESASQAIVTIPNLISMARLATVPLFVWLFVTGREEAAVIVYGVAAWTDFFDGFIARRTRSISELGRLLDPLADRIFIVAIALALVARGTLPWWLAAAVIGRDIVVLTAFPFLERRGIERLRVNMVGKTATWLLLLGLTLLAWSETSFPAPDLARAAGMVATSFGAVLYWIAGIIYAREAARRIARAGVGAGPEAP